MGDRLVFHGAPVGEKNGRHRPVGGRFRRRGSSRRSRATSSIPSALVPRRRSIAPSKSTARLHEITDNAEKSARTRSAAPQEPTRRRLRPDHARQPDVREDDREPPRRLDQPRTPRRKSEARAKTERRRSSAASHRSSGNAGTPKQPSRSSLRIRRRRCRTSCAPPMAFVSSSAPAEATRSAARICSRANTGTTRFTRDEIIRSHLASPRVDRGARSFGHPRRERPRHFRHRQVRVDLRRDRLPRLARANRSATPSCVSSSTTPPFATPASSALGTRDAMAVLRKKWASFPPISLPPAPPTRRPK